MNNNSRTNNVIKNILGGIGGQIFTTILQFICRTVFIQILGSTYLGVNGLFSNILSMLSLAELGIGSAIVFSMYKPISNNDERKIAQLLNFYKTAYRVVSLVVLIIGLCITPFLDFFIKDTKGIENIQYIFILILLNTVVSYLYAYKGSILNADQKAYVVVIIRNIFSVIQNVVQIILLYLTGNFICYLLVQIITTFAANVFQSKYVDKKYPFLINYKRDKLSQDEKQDIIKRVKGMMMHKIGGFVLNGTDNLVISKFVGVIYVGLYSNYLMIINIVKSYLSQITNGISASVGNLVAEDRSKSYGIFKSILLGHFWIYGFCFFSFWIIFQPFISCWLGENYLIDKSVLFVVLINFYLNGIQECSNTFINASGLFWETRKKPIFECLINLFVSIILAWKIGFIGVFLGTTISYFCTFWINPYILYRDIFFKNVTLYFIKIFIFSTITIMYALLVDFLLTTYIDVNIFYDVFIRIVVSIVVPNFSFILIFWRLDDFALYKNIIMKIKFKYKKRRSNRNV